MKMSHLQLHSSRQAALAFRHRAIAIAAPALHSRCTMNWQLARVAQQISLHEPLSCRAASGEGAPTSTQPAADPVKVSEVVKGCRTVLAELQGLDFPRNEVRLYFAAATKPARAPGQRFSSQPSESAAADVVRARAALEQLLKIDADGDPLPPSSFTDLQGLTIAQNMLSDIWRWRRRGGGMDYEDDDQARPHQVALRELQNFKPEDIDRVSSSLLDNLPLSDKDKKEMSGSVQQVVMGSFQGAVWGSLVLCIVFLIIFNFLRGG